MKRPGTYLHGEVVSFGVLVMLAYGGNRAELERYASFNREMGLPVTLAQIGLDGSRLAELTEYAHVSNEWKQGNPEPFEDARFIAAIEAADAYGRSLL